MNSEIDMILIENFYSLRALLIPLLYKENLILVKLLFGLDLRIKEVGNFVFKAKIFSKKGKIYF